MSLGIGPRAAFLGLVILLETPVCLVIMINPLPLRNELVVGSAEGIIDSLSVGTAGIIFTALKNQNKMK